MHAHHLQEITQSHGLKALVSWPVGQLERLKKVQSEGIGSLPIGF